MPPDPATADRLARDWIGYAFGWARRRCPWPLDWEQVAVDALAEAIRTNEAGPILPIAHLRHHLRSARGDALKYHRAKCRRGTVPLAEGSGDELPAPGQSPVGHALELADELAAALPRVPARIRLLLIAGAFDGLTHDDLARPHGLTRQATYQAIRKALAAIRDETEAD